MPCLRITIVRPLLVAVSLLVVTGLAAKLPEPRSPAMPTAASTDISTAVEAANAELGRLWAEAGIEPAAQADDLTILRRLSLAVLGTIPSFEEIRQFEADVIPDRLDRWTASILEDERFADYFAERLARSYVGVEQGQFLIFRRDRFLDWLSAEIREHRPYDDMVRAMISGQGVWTGEGEVNFLTAAYSNDEFDPNVLTARTVRAFLGQRIDCAQCHDHPFDHWKQHDFEGLAACFGQVELSLAGVVDNDHVEFLLTPSAVKSLSSGAVPVAVRREFRRHRCRLTESARIRSVGTDCWVVTEILDQQAVSGDEESSKPDAEEPTASTQIRYVIRKSPAGYEVHQRQGEYFVEDRISLEQRLVVPAVPFHEEWLATEGTRRERLAKWVTHPDNQRFERAIVNRVWGLLFGEPFLTDRPVDDLPDPETNPDLKLLDILGADFRMHGYDLRRLIRVIAASKAFQMQSIHPRESQVEAAALTESAADQLELEMESIRRRWGVFPLVRLRPEQVIGAMLQAGFVRTIDQNSHLFTRFLRFVREQDFVRDFGDPGVDELSDRAGTIPQALLRMNGEFAAEISKPNPLSAAGRIGMMMDTPESTLEALYLLCLTRRPTDPERDFFLSEAALSGKNEAREEAIQDMMWTLFNSPEFSWNH